jgi:hypothetical protein
MNSLKPSVLRISPVYVPKLALVANTRIGEKSALVLEEQYLFRRTVKTNSIE